METFFKIFVIVGAFCAVLVAPISIAVGFTYDLYDELVVFGIWSLLSLIIAVIVVYCAKEKKIKYSHCFILFAIWCFFSTVGLWETSLKLSMEEGEYRGSALITPICFMIDVTLIAVAFNNLCIKSTADKISSKKWWIVKSVGKIIEDKNDLLSAIDEFNSQTVRVLNVTKLFNQINAGGNGTVFEEFKSIEAVRFITQRPHIISKLTKESAISFPTEYCKLDEFNKSTIRQLAYYNLLLKDIEKSDVKLKRINEVYKSLNGKHKN